MKENEFIEKHKKMVTIIVRKFSRANNEQDLMQEGMLALLRARDTFREGSGAKFETYASCVIRNHLIDILRRQKNNPDISSECPDNTANHKFSPEAEEQFLEKSSTIKKILTSLPEIERAIFNCYFQGYSYDEIVKIFNTSKKKIDNTIQKVRKLIKESF